MTLFVTLVDDGKVHRGFSVVGFVLFLISNIVEALGISVRVGYLIVCADFKILVLSLIHI